ncbi:hypothetical protein PTKIN_Ptkin17bG0009700 [Pterospermum kingtungense]
MEGDMVDAESIFSEGKEVEVTSVEEGFRGAWFSATVVKSPTNNKADTREQAKAKGKKHVWVQYNTLLAEGSQTPLTEKIKLSFVRPMPPQPQSSGDHCFQVDDVVDAFHLDGWWTGTVSQVFDDDPKKYVVSFAEPPEEIQFSSSDLRPHWEWVHGKWVKSSEFQEFPVSSDSKESLELSCKSLKDAGAIVLHESSAAVESSIKNFEICYVSSRRTKGPARSKRIRATGEGDATPLHPSKKFKDGSSPNLLLPEPHMKDNEQPNVECRGKENVGLLKKCGSELKLDAEGLQYSAADKMDNLKVASVEISEVEQMTKEVESSVQERLPTECMSGLVTEESCHVTKEKEHGMDWNQKENGAKSGINRRDQPRVVYEINQPKILFQISQSPSAGKYDAVDVVKETVSEEYAVTEVDSSAITRLEQAGSQTMSIERTEVVSATDSEIKLIKEAGKSGRILHQNDEQSPLICDKELHYGLQNIHSVLEEEYSDVPPGFEDIWRDPRVESPQIMVQSPLAGKTGDNVPEGQNLPFVKSFPIWKAVELMEIFQIMPQNPHFQPLLELNEILREGVAIGHMLTFASMVQRTSKLTVADPRNLFTSILDALLDLEKLGFDVKAVKNRASDLLFMKDRNEHLQEHSKEVEVQATQLSTELTKINEEIDANNKLIKELQEKQALLSSMQKSKMFDIASLQVSADVNTQDIHNVEYDFESLAARPW